VNLPDDIAVTPLRSQLSSVMTRGRSSVYILFEDFTHVKFYRLSPRASVELGGPTFDGFHHVEDYLPPSAGS
jgi:hypothetical protein